MAAKKRHHHEMGGMYEGNAGRRHQEMKDAGMIHEDKQAVANMPQGVMYKPWPSSYVGLDSRLDDTISGVNRQMDMDDREAKRHNVPKKW
jgi:hypothetical protein